MHDREAMFLSVLFEISKPVSEALDKLFPVIEAAFRKLHPIRFLSLHR